MWGYRHHEALRLVLQPIRIACHALIEYSWQYAHYKNGNGSPLGVSMRTFRQILAALRMEA